MAKKTKAQIDWEYPDLSKATVDDLLNGLLAMRPGEPEDALTKAEAHLPRLRPDWEYNPDETDEQ